MNNLKSTKSIMFFILVLVLVSVTFLQAQKDNHQEYRIQLNTTTPMYWQYNGKPYLKVWICF